MSDDRLRELGQQLPYDRPDAQRREAVRSSLLVAATQSDPGTARKRWLLVGGGFAAGALAAAAIALVVVSPRSTPGSQPPPREAHARVEAPPTAKLEHTVIGTATGTDEVVRVRAGVVRVAVPGVKRGDRVRMQTADAEVEGTGAYEVVVNDDHLERVTVSEGHARVRVRVDGRQQQVFLAEGQTWRATIVTADLDLPPPSTPPNTPSNTPPPEPVMQVPAVSSAPRPTTPRARATEAPRNVSEAPSTGETPRMPAVTTLESVADAARIPAATAATKRAASATELHFQRGWSLLREGKASEAAVELGTAADAGGDDPLASDARYFQAVALVRAGQAPHAEKVLVGFLDRAPHSLRRGRAAILLGKLVRDRGETKSARAWFESALNDSDPAIAGAARAHLDALAPSR